MKIEGSTFSTRYVRDRQHITISLRSRAVPAQSPTGLILGDRHGGQTMRNHHSRAIPPEVAAGVPAGPVIAKQMNRVLEKPEKIFDKNSTPSMH
ncbi:MAG: hypothetical protein ABSG49_05650 [Methanoregula sp.]|jgi:hypothetical protein|uniref:hypothetical protein n=1 Tax=Methanoregula sp. TaxID=2052170 RepID=UPI003C27BDBE